MRNLRTTAIAAVWQNWVPPNRPKTVMEWPAAAGSWLVIYPVKPFVEILLWFVSA